MCVFSFDFLSFYHWIQYIAYDFWTDTLESRINFWLKYEYLSLLLSQSHWPFFSWPVHIYRIHSYVPLLSNFSTFSYAMYRITLAYKKLHNSLHGDIICWYVTESFSPSYSVKHTSRIKSSLKSAALPKILLMISVESFRSVLFRLCLTLTSIDASS